jgi:hypothetical protein
VVFERYSSSIRVVNTRIHSYSLVFVGIRWYSLVFVGIRWYSLVFVGIRWYSLVFVGIRWYSLGNCRSCTSTSSFGINFLFVG